MCIRDSELKQKLTDGRIAKIAQPEADELLLTIKSPCGQHRLLISANASLQLIYLTDTNKPVSYTHLLLCLQSSFQSLALFNNQKNRLYKL